MILKAEKIVDGVATPSALNYTVESNILPTTANLNQSFLSAQNAELNMGGGFSSETYYHASYIATFGKLPQPFRNGSIILTEEGVDSPESPMLQLYTQPKYLVGAADAYTTYSGSSTVNGTINKKESYSKAIGPDHIHYHLVYDFPTHAANNREIKEVHFLPKPWNSNNLKEPTGSRRYAEKGLTCHVNKTLMNVPGKYGFSEYLTYSKLSIDDSTGNCIFVNGINYICFISYNGMYGPAEFSDSVLAKKSGINVFVRGGNFCFSYSVNTYLYDHDGSSAYWELEKIYFSEEKGVYIIDTVKRPMPLIRNGICNVKMFEWDGFMYVLQKLSSDLYIAKYNLDLTEVVSYKVVAGGYAGNTSLDGSEFSVIHRPKTDTCLIGQMSQASGNRALFNVDKDLNIETINPNGLGNVVKKMTNTYQKLPNTKAYGCSFLQNPYVNYSSTNDPLDVRVGYVDDFLDDPVLTFKLQTPLVKKADETLKLTFDIHLKNGDIYTE